MRPYFTGPHGTLYQGDSMAVLSALPAESVQCCVTSPPYWGLRDYGVSGQIGQEETPQEHVARLAAVFREVHRVLKNDGVLWVNYGDTYQCNPKGSHAPGDIQSANRGTRNFKSKKKSGFPTKNLLGIPWRLAFAMQDDGWILRTDIIWHKPNPMPESVKDRPTRAHEYLFLFSKRPKYFYDWEAIREPGTTTREQALSFARIVNEPERPGQANKQHRHDRVTKTHTIRHGIDTKGGGHGEISFDAYTRNKRTVWTIPTHPYKDAHFATFPPELVKTCIRAASRHGDTILDPFFGSGTTGMVARVLGRKWIGVELNLEYCALSMKRIGTNRLMLTELESI